MTLCLSSLIAIGTSLGATASIVLAATPAVNMTMSASPAKTLDGAAVTWKAVVKPASGTPSNLVLQMQSAWYQISVGSSFVVAGGTCEPAPCTVDSRTGNPTWTFSSLTGPVTLSYHTLANTGATTTLWILSDGTACSGTCPATATMPIPTITPSVSYTSNTGDVRSGSVLHVTIAGVSSVGPLPADLQGKLSAGLGWPKAIVPSSAHYSPAPAHYIDSGVNLSPTPTTLTFDTLVSAANGSTVTLTAWIYPSVSKVENASSAVTLKVSPDTVAPTVTAPKQTLVSAKEIVTNKLPVRLTWTGSDALSGIARYELGQSTDGAPYAVVSTQLTTPTLDASLFSGHTYRYRVRAVDRRGNTSAWKYGTTFRLSGISEASGSVHYAGTWAKSTSTTWWGGTARSSSVAGSTATYTFTGRSIAWVGLKSTNRGKAQVYVNGTLVTTIDLYSASTLKQRYVWVANYSTSAARTIKIRVLATSTRPRVDVDGFVVGS